jgi:hypothetical protein
MQKADATMCGDKLLDQTNVWLMNMEMDAVESLNDIEDSALIAGAGDPASVLGAK